MLLITNYFRYLLLGFLLVFLAGERIVIASPVSDLDKEYTSFQLEVVFADRNLEKAIREELNVTRKITKYC